VRLGLRWPDAVLWVVLAVPLVPGAVGDPVELTAGLPFRTFLPAVPAGATGWCALHIGLGAAAGETARRVEKLVGTGSTIAAVAVVVVTAVVVLHRRKAASRSGIEKHRSRGGA
jgi:membrane-associated protein